MIKNKFLSLKNKFLSQLQLTIKLKVFSFLFQSGLNSFLNCKNINTAKYSQLVTELYRIKDSFTEQLYKLVWDLKKNLNFPKKT